MAWYGLLYSLGVFGDLMPYSLERCIDSLFVRKVLAVGGMAHSKGAMGTGHR